MSLSAKADELSEGEVCVKSLFIANLKAGDDLDNEPFLLQDVVRRTTKDNRPYLLYTLRDKTGSLSGVFWDVPDYVDSWAKPGLAILLTGKVNNYKEALQVRATDMNPYKASSMRDFLPSSKRSGEELKAALEEQIGRLAEPWQGLARHLLLTEPFSTDYCNAPAARGMHHAYIGGLLEHSLSMAQLGWKLAEHYDYVNVNRLVCGALIHDMGKALEYEVAEGFAFSQDGRLVGHIVRAIVLLEKAAAEINFPADELQQLVHLVGSHHGTQVWCAPVTPKTLEAILLHQLDLLDSRVQGYFDHVNNDAGQGEWTTRSSDMFRTELRKPDGYSG